MSIEELEKENNELKRRINKLKDENDYIEKLFTYYLEKRGKAISRQLKEIIRNTYDNQTIPFEDCEITTEKSEVTRYLNGERFFAFRELIKLCKYLKDNGALINTNNVIFPHIDRIDSNASYIPYHLLPVMPSGMRYDINNKLRTSAREEVYMLGVGFTRITEQKIWNMIPPTVKFKLLAYDVAKYEKKRERFFDKLIHEEGFTKECLKTKKTLNELNYKNVEVRYYDFFYPLNLTMIDPNTDNGEAIIEIMMPFTEISYKEMGYTVGDVKEKQNEKERPRPIFHINKIENPYLFNAIAAFINTLWEKYAPEVS